ncbi:CBS domain-containing protein [Candidatus Woesearchaeota archaeon]|jgi:CBS domain-containing protein|nr:CBS domain-containing protein [Candidatus Woesearchaeota archaeon]MBT6520028.1 CBS domain-containing protein [Candidatus Woesearchaeota archaeon]MBT7368611.1 CBS domain-containing protein [Candidatus Woesearchaeota archaeon]
MKTGIKVCDAMTCKPIQLDIRTSVRECAEMMEKHHVGSVLVKKGRELVGIVTEQDIVRKVVSHKLDLEKTIVGDITTGKVTAISPEQDIYEAIILMRDNNIRHLPVMDGETMVGFITGKDILKLQPQLFEYLAEVIEIREQDRKLGL